MNVAGISYVRDMLDRTFSVTSVVEMAVLVRIAFGGGQKPRFGVMVQERVYHLTHWNLSLSHTIAQSL